MNISSSSTSSNDVNQPIRKTTVGANSYHKNYYSMDDALAEFKKTAEERKVKRANAGAEGGSTRASSRSTGPPASLRARIRPRHVRKAQAPPALRLPALPRPASHGRSTRSRSHRGVRAARAPVAPSSSNRP